MSTRAVGAQRSSDFGIFGTARSRMPDATPGPDDPAALVAAAKKAGGFAWIGLTNPSEQQVRDLGAQLGLHPLAILDAAAGRQQPKVQFYDEHLFVTLWMLRARDNNLPFDVVETFIFAADNLVITVEHGDAEVGRIRSAIEGNLSGEAGAMGAVYRIMASATVEYSEITSDVEDELERLEDQVFDPGQTDDARRIYGLRRRIGRVNRAVSGLTRSLERVVDDTENRMMGNAAVRPFLRDLLDDLVGCHQLSEDQANALAGIIATHENSVAISQSRDARRISAVAALIAVPAVVAGIYGMNFKNLPGVNWALGWLMVLAGIIAIMSAVAFMFRRARWL